MAEYIQKLTTATEQLTEFITLNGATIGDISIKASSGGLGVFSNKAIPAKTPLVRVPLRLCISVEQLVASRQLNTIFNDNPGIVEYPDEVLAIGIMYATLHPEDCEWAYHVATFPQTVNTPIYWTEDELKELGVCTTFHIAKMMSKQIEVDFEGIHKALAENYPDILGGITLEAYAWALSMVYSRAIEFVKDKDTWMKESDGKTTQGGGTVVRAIVPLLDMANHNPEVGNSTDTFHFDQEKGEVCFLAAGNINAGGSECFAVYGHYPNSKLLLTYGFVVQNNPVRAIDLWTKVTQATANGAKKQSLLQSNPLTRNQTYDFKGTIRPGYVSPALLATIRVIQADEAEMDYVANAFNGIMISPRNEAATYVSLRAMLTARMRLETAESDRDQLGRMLLAEDVDYSSRLLMALIIRVEERELLQETVGLVNAWIVKLEKEGMEYKTPDSEQA